MKKGQLLVLLAVAAVTAIAALVVTRLNAPSSQGSTGVGARLLPDFPLNDVAKIRVTSRESNAVVTRGEEGWTVESRQGYPADFETVRTLLQSAWETTTAQSVTAGPAQFARLELLKPGDTEVPEGSGTLVEFLDKNGGELAWLVLGKTLSPNSSNPGAAMGGATTGRYVTTSSSPGRVWVISDTLTQADPKPEQWLDKSFFSVSAPREIAVADPEGKERWKAERVEESADIQIVPSAKKEEYDEALVRGLNSILSAPLLSDVAAKDVSPETSGLDKPVTARIQTFDGFNYTFRIGAEAANSTRYLSFDVDADLPMERPSAQDEKPEDKDRLDKEFAETRRVRKEKLAKEQELSKWVFLVPDYNVETLLKTREDFFKKKEESPGQDTEGNAS